MKELFADSLDIVLMAMAVIVVILTVIVSIIFYTLFCFIFVVAACIMPVVLVNRSVDYIVRKICNRA